MAMSGTLQGEFWRKLNEITDDLVGEISGENEDVELLADLAKDNK